MQHKYNQQMNKSGANFNKSGFKFSIQKIEGAYIYNLEELIRLLSQIIKKLCDEDVISTLDIGQLNKLHSELKYHEKMKNNSDEEYGPLNRYVEEALTNLKNKNEEFPKIKHMNSNHRGELATIAEKYSEENLLSNYLRKNNQHTNSKYRRLAQLERHSETLNIDSQIYNRQQTRRSLDNPHMNHDRKPIYSELQRLKGKESGHSPNKVLVDHGRKFIIKSKLPNYTISKLI